MYSFPDVERLTQMLVADQPHTIKHHASKITGHVTPRTKSPGAQRRGKIYFEFEHLVARGKLRANWPQKAILYEEYMEARGR